MALTKNQERLFVEMVAVRVQGGNQARILTMLRQLRTITEAQLVTALKAFAVARRDQLAVDRTNAQPDLDFYTQEAL